MARNSQAISAITVPFKVDTKGLSKGFDDAGKEGKKFAKDASDDLGKASIGVMGLARGLGSLGGSPAKALGLVSLGLVGVATAAIAAGIAIGKAAFGRISDLGKDALAIGATATELSKLRNAALATGTDYKSLSSFVETLTDKINESIGKTELQANSFAKLGTSAEALSKMTVGEQLKTLNKGFNALPNDAERAKVAMALAGKVGAENFRLLTMSVEDFDKAYKDGMVTTDEDVSEIRKLEIALNKIVDSVEKLANLFTTMLAPAIASVADMLQSAFSKIGPLFGIDLNSSKGFTESLKKMTGTAPKADAQNQAKQANKAKADQLAKASQADLDQRKKVADQAQAKVDDLQKRRDKQALSLATRPGGYVPSTNGNKLVRSRQKDIDSLNATEQELNAAKKLAATRKDEAKSQAQALSDAIRMKKIDEEIAALSSEYAENIKNSGQDEIHRRVNAIKGLSTDQRKKLIAQGYQDREASKTSSLRDELQESTKFPIEKLSEDIGRINKMVALGAANGGLTRQQGIRAIAQKTQESGLGGPVQFGGAMSASSAEGRSYLLSQFTRDDTASLARRGLELTGQTNAYLNSINQRLNQQRELVATY